MALGMILSPVPEERKNYDECTHFSAILVNVFLPFFQRDNFQSSEIAISAKQPLLKKGYS